MSRLTVSKPEFLINGDDRVFRQFVHDFLAFSARLQEVRARFGAVVELGGTAYTTLISIMHLQSDNGIGVNDLADHLHLSGAFVTAEVGKLVQAGLVKKIVNAADRRRVLLTVTAKARALLDELAVVQCQVNDVLFDCVRAEHVQILCELMAELVSCGDRAMSLLAFLEHGSRKRTRTASRQRGLVAKKSNGRLIQGSSGGARDHSTKY